MLSLFNHRNKITKNQIIDKKPLNANENTRPFELNRNTQEILNFSNDNLNPTEDDESLIIQPLLNNSITQNLPSQRSLSRENGKQLF